ncbi:hypothetical protein, partial [Nocardioides sp.]|uniref:hypothetical protein n=1 Tax=Nocardioides sp. TaxID=35761 RepID=UPI00273340AC
MASRRQAVVLPVTAVLMAIVVVAPLLGSRGIALLGDMVFVPDQPWKDAWTGGDGGVPRAVPVDAWVSLVDNLVPGDVLQTVILLGLLVGAGLGVATLTTGLSGWARLAAMVMYVWNPFVHERLAIGHWALLCGYAALPWLVHGARRVREGDGRGWSVAVSALAVAGWTSPTGGALCAAVLVVLLLGARSRQLVAALLAALLVNLPWIVPGVLSTSDQAGADPFGVAAFAARSDTPWGLVGSLMGFGGIWKESIIPAARDQPLLSGMALVLVVAGLSGLWIGRRRGPAPPVGLLVVAGLGFLMALLPGLSWGRPPVEWLVVNVPGGGLLRDSQKWLMPYVLVASVGLGLLVDRLARSVPPGAHARFWLAALVSVPVLTLPSLLIGLNGDLRPGHYPAEWDRARATMETQGARHDRVVVLPFGTYRRFDWMHGRAVLDPAPRFFPGHVVTDDALVVTGGTVRGESRVAERIRSAATAEQLDEELEAAGIRWVLLHRGDSGVPGVLPGRVVMEGEELTVVDRGRRTPLGT